ncbi:MAG: RNA polymerase sigma factor [Candidatus Limnocylindria bacterium]
MAERQSGVTRVARELAAGDLVISDAANRQIVEDLHAQLGQSLWGFARRLGLQDGEADEIVQESMLRLWRELLRGRPVERPAAWLFRTAYRLAMDRHRLRRRWQAFTDRFAPAGNEADLRDELLATWSEVDRLPARQRQVLYLRYRTDLAFEAIGEVLGIDPASARSNAARGIARLRERLGEEEG